MCKKHTSEACKALQHIGLKAEKEASWKGSLLSQHTQLYVCVCFYFQKKSMRRWTRNCKNGYLLGRKKTGQKGWTQGLSECTITQFFYFWICKYFPWSKKEGEQPIKVKINMKTNIFINGNITTQIIFLTLMTWY